MTLAVDGQKHCIQRPLVAGRRPSAPEPIDIVLPARQTPVPAGFIGDVDASFDQRLLLVPVNWVEAIGEPDYEANNFAGNTVIYIVLGGGGRGHAWLPLCICYVMDHGGQQWRDYVISSEGR
jgi:hypothetical protein